VTGAAAAAFSVFTLCAQKEGRKNKVDEAFDNLVFSHASALVRATPPYCRNKGRAALQALDAARQKHPISTPRSSTRQAGTTLCPSSDVSKLLQLI
jgi:hypothetical protein